MSILKVSEYPIEADLNILHTALTGEGIPYRITEESGQQVLWLLDDRFAERAHELTLAFEDGRLRLAPGPPAGKNSYSLPVGEVLLGCPFTFATIILGISGYILGVHALESTITQNLMFDDPADILDSGKFWRFFSPAYLHFSALHILFNGLWIWELGKRLELFLGIRNNILLFLFVAVGANYVQYVVGGGDTYFGGLSGVVYGYLGFLWVAGAGSKSRHPLLHLPPGIFVFMFVWLLLGFFGVIDMFIDGRVANGAHLGGLLFGVASALFYFAIKKKEGNVDEPG